MERYYPESEVAGIGLELVKQNVGTVFKESDGAIVFDVKPTVCILEYSSILRDYQHTKPRKSD